MHFQGAFSNNIKQGVWKYYDEKGRLTTAANFTENTLNGEKTFFDDNGTQLVTEYFEQGNFTGNTDYFSPDGSIKARMEIRNQSRTFQAYHSNGTLRFKTVDWKNKKNDTTKVYFSNGQIKEELSFYKNILLAIGTTYSADGTPINNGDFKDGAGRVIRYFDDLSPSSIAMYKAGLKNGIAQFYHANGRIESAGMFARGAKTGVWKYYSPEGELINSIEHRGDEKDDEFTRSFSPDGLAIEKRACSPEFPGGNRGFNRFLKESFDVLDTLKGSEIIVTIELDEYGFSQALKVHSDVLDKAGCTKLAKAIKSVPRCLPAFEEGMPISSTLTQPYRL